MSTFAKTLRKKLEAVADSDRVTGAASALIARRLRKLHAGTTWEYDGRDALEASLRDGPPVIMALWHGRLAEAPFGWNPDWGTLCVITSAARPGRMVGRVMRHFDHETLPMRDRKSNAAASLQLARMARDGISLGFAVDGPEGPARVAKSVPIDWARLTGCRICLWTYSVERYRTLGSWDRLILPKRGGRGIVLYRHWDVEIPKRLDETTRESLRARLEADLNALTLEADRRMGHDEIIA